MHTQTKGISACLVVYNEESVIKRCLESIAGLVQEIIVVHDGICSDETLKIVRQYTDKIFVRQHIGEAEPHRVFALENAQNDWILQIDADEYIDPSDHEHIKKLVTDSAANGYIFQWEMWNGYKTIHFPGLQKLCLYRKNNFHYIGIPHEPGSVDGGAVNVNIKLHHRPAYNNIGWTEVMKKTKKWSKIHANYFFPELVKYECFNSTPDAWLIRAGKIKKHLFFYAFWDPIRMILGQLKNGLWKNKYGLLVIVERYVYYIILYREISRIKRNLVRENL